MEAPEEVKNILLPEVVVAAVLAEAEPVVGKWEQVLVLRQRTEEAVRPDITEALGI